MTSLFRRIAVPFLLLILVLAAGSAPALTRPACRADADCALRVVLIAAGLGAAGVLLLSWFIAELAARPELVRTMSVKPPSGQGKVRLLDIEGVDLQPCGGTHVARTSEIGGIEVAKIENKGRINRRVRLRFGPPAEAA